MDLDKFAQNAKSAGAGLLAIVRERVQELAAERAFQLTPDEYDQKLEAVERAVTHAMSKHAKNGDTKGYEEIAAAAMTALGFSKEEEYSHD